MFVKAAKMTFLGLHGLVQTLCVIVALTLGMPNESSSQAMKQSLTALFIVEKARMRHFYTRELQNLLLTRSDSLQKGIHLAHVRSIIFVYRPKEVQYEGPFPIFNKNSKDTTVLLQLWPGLSKRLQYCC